MTESHEWSEQTWRQKVNAVRAGRSLLPTRWPDGARCAVALSFDSEFEGAREEGGLFLLTMHPHIIGYRSRIFILEEMLKHVATTGDCWIATHAEIASYCLSESTHAGNTLS